MPVYSKKFIIKRGDFNFLSQKKHRAYEKE